MKAGETFFIRDRNVDTHLWVIVSNPDKDPERVVMVSLTTYQPYKEDICLLDVGDHCRISHKTCVAYNEARLISLDKLAALKANNALSMQEPVSLEVLTRIRDGFSKSTKVNFKYIEILIGQGVIE